MSATNLTLDQGTTFRVQLTYRDSTGALVNLTNYAAHMQIRRRIGSAILADLSTGNGCIVLGGAAGTIDIYCSAQTTTGIEENCVYDLHLISRTDPEDIVRIFGGTIVVQRAVTFDDRAV